MKRLLILIYLVVLILIACEGNHLAYADGFFGGSGCLTWSCLTGSPSPMYSSGVLTGGHAAGFDATGTYIVDIGAWVTDNSTASTASPLNTNFLKKDTGGYIANQNIIESRGAIFDGGGSVIANGKIVYLYFPYAGTISKFTSICNAADASLTFDIFRLAFSAGNTLPTTSIIGAGNYLVPTTAEAQITPASWTSTQIVAGDVLAIKVTNVAATAVWCNVAIDVTR
jgi:hypothetical protein